MAKLQAAEQQQQRAAGQQHRVTEQQRVEEPTLAAYIDGYARMLLIRHFETAMHRLFLRGEIHGTTHLYAGQEACAVGVCMALESEDYVAGTYRGHGHALAKGTEAEPLAAEMLGRETGVCGGRAGSMNVVDIEHGLLGCYGIVGGSIAAALGASISGRRLGRVAACFFGDGASNQAYFHECLNMAAVQKLPLILVCENNLYGEFTPLEASTAGADIAARAAGYGLPAEVVDGNDLWAVEAAARRAADRARAGHGPTLLELRTYRHYGHSKSDPAPYRTKEELDSWLERDPLKLARERLLSEGATEEQLGAVEAVTSAALDQAVERALAAPYPQPAADAATEYAA